MLLENLTYILPLCLGLVNATEKSTVTASTSWNDCQFTCQFHRMSDGSPRVHCACSSTCPSFRCVPRFKRPTGDIYVDGDGANHRAMFNVAERRSRRGAADRSSSDEKTSATHLFTEVLAAQSTRAVSTVAVARCPCQCRSTTNDVPYGCECEDFENDHTNRCDFRAWNCHSDTYTQQGTPLCVVNGTFYLLHSYSI